MAESGDEAGQMLGRLDDAAVRERLTRLDELLAQVEAIPGPSGELALDAVSRWRRSTARRWPGLLPAPTTHRVCWRR